MPTIEQIVQRQVSRWELEARARREPGARRPDGRPFPFVTVSRDHGSGGHQIAEAVAERLGWVYLDRQIVDYVAAHAKVRTQIVELLDEHTRGHIEAWLRSHLSGRYMNEADYARHLACVVRAVVHHDPVVLLGRGGAYMLASESQYGLHVRITAPFDLRVRRIAESQSIPSAEARVRVLTVDHDRVEFLRSVFHRDGKDPLDYDLVINTARCTSQAACGQILRMLESRQLVSWQARGDQRTPVAHI